MEELLWFIATLAVSCTFGFAAHKLKIPMGAMLGAMISAAAFNLITGGAVFNTHVRTALQLLTGAMIGCRIGVKEAKSMKTILLPSSIMLIGMVSMNMAFGAAVYNLSELDIVTSLFSVTPGGATDMAIISSELGANTAYVAILQILRIIIIITLLPPIFKLIVKKTHYNEPDNTIIRTEEAMQTRRERASGAEGVDSGHPHDALPTEPFRYNRRETLLLAGLFLSAACGGLLLRALDVPAGAVIGAMLFGVAYSIVFGKAVYPKKLRPWQQILAGAYIGASIDRQTVASMDVLLIPLLIMVVGILVFVFMLSFIIHKATKLDFITCLLACTPGGITEMSLLSEEFGSDTPKIAVMQTVRLIIVIMLFPAMLQAILRIVG